MEELRRLAYEDLDRALLLGVETTIQEMWDRRLPIHTNTLRARDWLREHGDDIDVAYLNRPHIASKMCIRDRLMSGFSILGTGFFFIGWFLFFA